MRNRKWIFKIPFKYYGGRKWGRGKERIIELTEVTLLTVKHRNNSIIITRPDKHLKIQLRTIEQNLAGDNQPNPWHTGVHLRPKRIKAQGISEVDENFG